jgi:hypothetical protein
VLVDEVAEGRPEPDDPSDLPVRLGRIMDKTIHALQEHHRRREQLDPSVQRTLARFNSPDLQRTLARFDASAVPRMFDRSRAAKAQRTLARFNSPTAQRTLARFNSPEAQRAFERLTTPSPAGQRVIERLSQPVSWSRLAEAARVVAREYGIEPEAEEQLAALEDELPGPEDASGSWADALAGLSFVQQVALVTAALLVLDQAGQFLTSLTGENVPEPVRAAIELLFAVIAFLLLWIEQSDRRD